MNGALAVAIAVLHLRAASEALADPQLPPDARADALVLRRQARGLYEIAVALAIAEEN